MTVVTSLPPVEPSVAALPATLNPWFTMWTRPGATIRMLLAEQPRRSRIVVTFMGGFAFTLLRVLERPLPSHMSVSDMLVRCAVLGGFGGLVIGLWVMPFLVTTTGRRLGGTATDDDVRVAIAWSNVPLAWTWVVLAPALLAIGRDLFGPAFPAWESLSLAGKCMLVLFATTVVAAPWATAVQVKALSEVQGFSIWRALLNFFLACLAILLPLLAVAMIYITAYSP